MSKSSLEKSEPEISSRPDSVSVIKDPELLKEWESLTDPDDRGLPEGIGRARRSGTRWDSFVGGAKGGTGFLSRRQRGHSVRFNKKAGKYL